MKKIMCAVLCSLTLLSPAFADPIHQHPQAKPDALKALPFGSCEIEIVNNTFDDIYVYGRFDDGTYLAPFTIKHWGAPQFVSLFFYGYCHLGMDFYIETAGGNYKYSGFTPVGKTIQVGGF